MACARSLELATGHHVVSFVTVREIEISTPTVREPSACSETAEAKDIGCVAEFVMTVLGALRPNT